MVFVLIKSLIIFITIIEVILLVYIFLGMFHIGFLKKPITLLLEPILLPIQILMKHSVFHSPVSDISPIMAFIILSYIEQLLS
jgi:uncharacterized protein YggT (Ycf19 family)